MTTRIVIALLMMTVPLPGSAAVTPAPGRVDARVREVDYRADEVVRLTGYVGYHLHLELAPGESFVALGAGDSAAVDIAAEGRHIMLKPKAARVATNLTLVSSRRVYHFEYRVLEAAPSEATAMFSLRFRYPDPASEVAPVATPLPFSSVSAPTVEESPAPPLRVRTVNRSYWFCGWPALQPVAASDDGVQTRLTFAATAEWPAIFVRNDDGSESLVNFHADGTTAVVHRVARQFVLRRGALVGCVENRAYGGGGSWVANGAHDPATVREVRK